jgi:hypothetical protein
MSEICQKCKGIKEKYTYIRNQPKNIPKIVLQPIEENYDYGYDYAMYKPEKHEIEPSHKEEQKWQGVL